MTKTPKARKIRKTRKPRTYGMSPLDPRIFKAIVKDAEKEERKATRAAAKAAGITKATVATRRNEYGEWVVRAFVDGVRFPEGDYFTEDKQDAHATAKAMVYRCSDCGTGDPFDHSMACDAPVPDPATLSDRTLPGTRIISTERYIGAHGRGPWGAGTWAFDVEHADGRETLWAPINLIFSEACRWVRREIKRHGWTAHVIEVAS